MTVATAPATLPDRMNVATATAAPTLVPGTELLGEFRGSGYRQPPSLVRRSDGQMLQLTRLTYLVASLANGTRDIDAIAHAVSERSERPITAEGVRFLVDNKLAPLGLVSYGAAPVVTPMANPLLALRGRATLLAPRVTNFLASALRPMFFPVVVAAVVTGVGVLDFWLFVEHGLGRALRQALVEPTVLIAVLALTLLSAVFHELGHATGCRYGGARPGAIGFGLYLLWPSFFTNVTDAYRLGRGGRLRTDLGGIYFNGVFILAIAGLYAVTGQEALLLVIVLDHFEMLEQLMPFVRFDGYFILSDIAGIPDLFARIGPVVRDALRAGPPDPRVKGLRTSSRLLVSVWTLFTIPLLGINLGYLVLQLPAIDGALWHSIVAQAGSMAVAFGHGRYAFVVLGGVSIAMLALTLGGTLYIAGGTTRRLVRFAHRATSGRLAARLLALAAAQIVGAGLVLVWISRNEFHNWHA